MRVLKSDLEKFDVTKLSETRDMDIEIRNYVIPRDVQAPSRIEISFSVEDSNAKKFLMKDW